MPSVDFENSLFSGDGLAAISGFIFNSAVIKVQEFKDLQLLPSFVFVLVNFVQSFILEAVQSMSLTSRKACWSLYSLLKKNISLPPTFVLL